jgi:hypothetical protein
LKMRHEHHIAGLVVLVVQSQEVDLAEHCPCSDDAFAEFEEICAKCLYKGSGIAGGRSRGDFGVEGFGDGLPRLCFENLNNLGGLRMLGWFEGKKQWDDIP